MKNKSNEDYWNIAGHEYRYDTLGPRKLIGGTVESIEACVTPCAQEAYKVQSGLSTVKDDGILTGTILVITLVRCPSLILM